MKRAILLHGTCSKNEYFSNKYPSLSNSHWFPWLQKELLVQNIFTQTPEIPEAYKPQYDLWKSEIEKFTIDEETILVGHSCGGGFFTRWLSENKRTIKALFLIAPWLDPDKKKTSDFFEFQMDNTLTERFPVHLFVSDDDETNIHRSSESILAEIPNIKTHRFSNMGHFTFGEMKTIEFPELLDQILLIK